MKLKVLLGDLRHHTIGVHSTYVPVGLGYIATYFEKMLMLRDDLNPALKLSMGMSSDYEVAIKFNSDIVRIGSLLFS